MADATRPLLGELTRQVEALRAEITVLVRPMAPGLLAISGVGELEKKRAEGKSTRRRFAV